MKLFAPNNIYATIESVCLIGRLILEVVGWKLVDTDDFFTPLVP